jgi:UDP-N-acetylmuramate--alanine ligase
MTPEHSHDFEGELDLSTPISIHLVGLGGAGMSAIATVLVEMGHEVSGSDLKDGGVLDRLRALGVRVAIGHAARNLGDAQILAKSTAIAESNVEVQAARRRGIPVLSRADLLASITALRRCAAISGTHGKTTTTSMLALILLEANLDPSFLIGGDVNEIGTSAAWGRGEWLVVEADESDGTFLRLGAELALVTNVDPDHLDHYGTVDALGSAFSRFLSSARYAVVCADHEVARSLAPESALTYGFSPDAEFGIDSFTGGRADISFVLRRSGAYLGSFELPVPGVHNALNAAGALCAAAALGVPMDAAKRALARFTGVTRRFAFRGEARGVTFVDDYAHLPAEIAVTLAAARLGGFERTVAVFQPHRYSRVASLADSFGDAFGDADVVVVTGIYGAGEPVLPGVSGRLIADAVAISRPDLEVHYLAQRGDLARWLSANLRAGDCCLTMSAGDLTTLPDELLQLMTETAR